MIEHESDAKPPERSATHDAQTAAGEPGEVGRPDLLPPASVLQVADRLKPYIDEPEDRRRAARIALQIASETFSADLPHPRHFEHYERAVKGSGLRLIVIAETEQRQRHLLERRQMIYPYAGLACGFLIALCCVAGAIYLGAIGRNYMASVLVGLPVVGVIGWFIKARIAGPNDSRTADRTSVAGDDQ